MRFDGRLCVNMLHVEPGDEVLCDYMFEDWDPDMVTHSLPVPSPDVGRSADLQVDCVDASNSFRFQN